MTEKNYTINSNGNFLCIAENNKEITGYFDSYQKEDLIKIVDLLNEQEQRIEALESAFIKDLESMYNDCMKCEKRYQELIKELEQEVETLQVTHGVSDLCGDVE